MITGNTTVTKCAHRSQRTVIRNVGVCATLTALMLLASLAKLDAQSKGEPTGKKYALLVGVTKYNSQNFSDLTYSDNDAEQMEPVLKRAGFVSVRVLTSRRGEKNYQDAPTTANIQSALKELLAKKSKYDTVLVGLAGHGIQLEVKPEKGEGPAMHYSYFCPSDASFQGISYSTGKSDQLLLLDDLFEQLGKCDAGHRLALIDACRNDGKAQAATRRVDIGRVTIPDNVGVIFSCSRRQFAFETRKLGHGVFFHHVIEGLKGEAADKEGVVTWDGLAAHVKRHVPRFVEENFGKDGGKQVPASMGNLEGESVLARIVVEKSKDINEKDEIENSIGMKFVRVKKGKFLMGESKDVKDRTIDQEQHEVTLTKDFHMGVTEVTQGQFKKMMGFNPSFFSRNGTPSTKGTYHIDSPVAGGRHRVADLSQAELDHFPVENVSYVDAQEFLSILNARAEEQKAGRKYRLPTEAEWEYACRGGHLIAQLKEKAQLPFHFKTPIEHLTTNLANFNRDHRTTMVGTFEANCLGLRDMHGNVCEVCSDWYDKDYYPNGGTIDPTGPLKGSTRVCRGGGYTSPSVHCRASARLSAEPWARNVSNGFRVVLIPPAR